MKEEVDQRRVQTCTVNSDTDTEGNQRTQFVARTRDVEAAAQQHPSKMIKKKFSTPFHFFPTIPILSLPGGPGDVPIISDKNTVGWYIGPHRLVDSRAHELPQLFNNASCVYVQARRNG